MTDDAPIARTGPGPPLVTGSPAAGAGAENGRGRTWPLAVTVGAAAAAIGWFHMPAGVTGWLYAEDGVLFVGDWIGPGANVSVLWTPYAGYQHLIPRITTGLITGFLPVAWWGVAVNMVACLMVGGIAALVFVLSRDVIAFVPSRVMLGLITTLVPLVAVEAIGNLANLHWFLLYLTPWLLLATPRSALGSWVLAAVAMLTTLTEPQCAVFLPLAIARLTPWKVFPRAGRPVIWAWLIGVTAQLITTVLAPRPVSAGFPPVASAVQGYVLNAGMSLSTVNTELLGRVLTHVGWWIGFVGVAAIFTLAGLAFG